MAQARIRAVVFDYGGVLTSPVRHSIGRWLAADGIEPESFSRTLKAWLSRDAPEGTPIHRLETGALSVVEFDRLLAAELRTTTGTPVAPDGVLARMFAGTRLDEEMFTLVEDLRGVGIRVGMLSNSWGNNYPRERLDALFDSVVISSEVGVRKPHAAIFEMSLRQLGAPAGDAVFVDDAEPNLIGARAVGMQTILHRAADETRASLTELVPALDNPGAAR